MTAIFWTNFSKPNNSTKQPSGSGTSYTVYLKDNVSVLAPVFRIEGINLSVTYCQWNGRYYFVRDIVLSNNNIYEIHCEIDVMATWKTAVGSSSQYVLRSASQSDGTIVDGFYPTKKNPTLKRNGGTPVLPWATSVNGGYYVVGVISGSDSTGGHSGTIAQGVVQYYCMSPTSFNSFAQQIFTDANWTNFTTADRYTFNPIQYISSIQWFPFAPPVYGQPRQSIKLGWETITCVALIITDPTRVDQFTFAIDDHPQAGSRGIYLDSPPFSEYILKFVPFGDIEIDGAILAKRSSQYPNLYARMETDFISGRSRLIVSVITDTINYKFAIREVQFGVNIQIAQIAANRLGLAENLVSSAAGVGANLLFGNIPGAITGAVSGILSAYQTAQPRVQSTGKNDSMLNIISTSTEPYLYEVFHQIVDEDNATCGRPLCQQKTISSLSGYILCANTEISIAGLPSERDQIVQYMNNGFFYE